MTDARTMEDPLVYTRTVVGHAAYHAGQQGRTDLVERLERHRVLPSTSWRAPPSPSSGCATPARAA